MSASQAREDLEQRIVAKARQWSRMPACRCPRSWRGPRCPACNVLLELAGLCEDLEQWIKRERAT